jgi:hypothetical protein
MESSDGELRTTLDYRPPLEDAAPATPVRVFAGMFFAVLGLLALLFSLTFFALAICILFGTGPASNPGQAPPPLAIGILYLPISAMLFFAVRVLYRVTRRMFTGRVAGHR